ncbi:LAMI_0F13740g1_1 [Lachancea mirantina]|uniref:LAMI_0F13740g1_1 n=1 Tax=Lachancea mirantina TaxID=1230905 RepID=A0A1G4K3J1_9SACH|nr:LAMI_0F13740g1_1 [Lachancea mirantina]
MNSRSINGSYLPSHEARLASESRIAKINEIYHQARRKYQQHRDSVISNSSTSVQDVEDTDHCHPIETIGIGDQVLDPPVKEETVTIKRQPFESRLEDRLENRLEDRFHDRLETPKSNASSPFQDNYQEELEFTPQLRTKRSILTFRSLGQGTPRNQENRNPASRRNLFTRRERFQELKKRLGEPVPLEYLNHNSGSAPTDKLEAFLNRSHDLDLSSVPKSHSELYDVSHTPREVTGATSGSSLAGPSFMNNESMMAPNRIQDIDDLVRSNTDKLDQIMLLLNDIARNRHNSEITFWSICIVILIILNVYVYKL